MHLLCVCVDTHAPTHLCAMACVCQRTTRRCEFSALPCVFRGLTPDHQSWQQVSLLAKSSHQSLTVLSNCFNLQVSIWFPHTSLVLVNPLLSLSHPYFHLCLNLCTPNTLLFTFIFQILLLFPLLRPLPFPQWCLSSSLALTGIPRKRHKA